MQWRTWKPFFSTNHVAYFHQMIINNVSQMIGRKLVSTFVKHFIVQNIALYAYVTTNHVVDMNLLSWFNFETYSILFSLVD